MTLSTIIFSGLAIYLLYQGFFKYDSPITGEVAQPTKWYSPRYLLQVTLFVLCVVGSVWVISQVNVSSVESTGENCIPYGDCY